MRRRNVEVTAWRLASVVNHTVVSDPTIWPPLLPAVIHTEPIPRTAQVSALLLCTYTLYGELRYWIINAHAVSGQAPTMNDIVKSCQMTKVANDNLLQLQYESKK